MDCIFCKIVKGEIPCKKVYESDTCIVIMDNSPITDGHMLVIPKKHFKDYLDLDNDSITDIFNTAKKMEPIITKKLNAKSITLLINYGDDQQVKHFHLHLLPDFGTTDISKAKNKIEDNYKILTS